VNLPRLRVLGVAFALAALAGSARAAVPAHEPDDMALGSPKAPVTVIEYASVGCPHCAAWNNQVFPTIRAQYIATGKARLVVREELTGDGDVAAVGFMLARCAGPAKYFPVIDAIYHRQDSMYLPGATPVGVLRDIAKTVAGMADAAIGACLADKAALAAVNARSDRHLNVDKVESTPTFFVNGRRLEDELAPGDLAKAVRAAGRGPAHAAGRRK
jgi:protein-disulfide isomerase